MGTGMTGVIVESASPSGHAWWTCGMGKPAIFAGIFCVAVTLVRLRHEVVPDLGCPDSAPKTLRRLDDDV